MFRTTLIALVLGLAPLCAAQEPGASTPKPDALAKGSQPEKGELELASDELKRRGELVLTLCGDKCKDPKNTITGGVINGKALELVQPPYPALARAAHASGDVAILVIIDKEGKVMAAEAMSGHPLLFAASLKAAKESRFSPTMFDGKPTAVLGKLIYRFISQ